MKIRHTLVLAAFFVLALPGKAQLDKSTFQELKTLFGVINANLPLKMGPSGELYACDIDEQKITYYIHTPIIGAAMKLPDKEKRLQTIAMLSAMKGNKDVRSFYEIIAGVEMSLRIVVSDKTSGAKYEIVLSPDDIRQVLNNEFTSEEQLDIMLAQQKAACPMKVAEGLTVNRIYKENGLVVMGAEVDEMLVDLDELIAQKDAVREGIRRGFSSDLSQMQFLYITRNAGYGIQYLYKGNHTGQELPITFTHDDIQAMLGEGDTDEEEIDSAVVDRIALDTEFADSTADEEVPPLVYFEEVGFATIALPYDSQYDAETSEQTGFTYRFSESFGLATMHKTFDTGDDFNPETALLEQLVGMNIDPSTTRIQRIEQAEGHDPIPYVVFKDNDGFIQCLCICHNPGTREALFVITMEQESDEEPCGPTFIRYTSFN